MGAAKYFWTKQEGGRQILLKEQEVLNIFGPNGGAGHEN